MKKDNIKYNSSIRLSEQNYKYITKKASELGISDVEFQNFEELLFKTFETIEDEFFELGLLLGSMLGEEIEYENKWT